MLLHFFQGTENRKQLDLEQEIESMGAQLNSSISREHTAYYGTCLKKDMPKSKTIVFAIEKVTLWKSFSYFAVLMHCVNSSVNSKADQNSRSLSIARKM